MNHFARCCFGLLTALFWAAAPSYAYSVFTHEQLIDLTWMSAIRPLLQQRFPGITENQLNQAHAYAYGGCAIHDLGYYPFGKTFFSDVTHYVRTGDFVSSLLRNARNPDEYAFAIGALSHYIGDSVGHQDGINPATSIEFPKLAAKFGPSMTYDENPHAHVRTEFGFDVDQLSKHRLAPSAYLRFIGLAVSRDLLERAFYETYSLHLREVLGGRRPTFRSYNWAVRSFLPRIAYAETVLHRNQFTADATGSNLHLYEENLAQADFQNAWSRYRRRPGLKTHLVALLLKIVPKIGPLSLAKIRVPSARTEDLYVSSLNRSIGEFKSRLQTLSQPGDGLDLGPNRDLDTGRAIRPGEYPLTDQTYAKLLDKLGEHRDRPLPPLLRSEILAYFADPQALTRLHLSRKAKEKVAGQVLVWNRLPAGAP